MLWADCPRGPFRASVPAPCSQHTCACPRMPGIWGWGSELPVLSPASFELCPSLSLLPDQLNSTHPVSGKMFSGRLKGTIRNQMASQPKLQFGGVPPLSWRWRTRGPRRGKGLPLLLVDLGP